MRRRSVVSFAVLLGVLWSTASAVAADTHVRVSPGRGGVHAKFVLRFSIPNATGTVNQVNVSDYVVVRGPSRTGCVGELDQSLRPASAHTAFKVSLNPAHTGDRWCAGRFNGQLVQRTTNVCDGGPPAAIVCPLYVLAPQVLGRFHFTVSAHKK